MPVHRGRWLDLASLARLIAPPELAGSNVWDSTAASNIAAIAARVPPTSNLWAAFADAADVAGVQVEAVVPAMWRRMPPLAGDGVRPPWFAASDTVASPRLQLVRIPGGTLLQLDHAPLAVAGDGRTVLRDCSSRYAPLLRHVDPDYAPVVAAARHVSGTVLAIGDDVWPANVSHFLLDTLPRLGVLDWCADGAAVSVAVPELTQAWQREALHACGLTDDRIIEVGLSPAIRADLLLLTDDRRSPPHPAFGAAPWALRFLRRTVGGTAVGKPRAGRLYVSRRDSAGRRVVNEAALMAALAPRGFTEVTLSALPLAGQVAAFATAEMIVAPHGAGLAHLAFAAPGTRVVEIFPSSHGTPAFAMIGAALGLRYRAVICDDLVAAERPEFHDLRVDPAAVLAALDGAVSDSPPAPTARPARRRRSTAGRARTGGPTAG